jgi:hypothetical protein
MPKTTQYTYNTPHKVSQKYIGLHKKKFKSGEITHSLNKTYKETNTLITVFYN